MVWLWDKLSNLPEPLFPPTCDGNENAYFVGIEWGFSTNVYKAPRTVSGQEQALDKLLYYYSFPWICQQGFGVILCSHGWGSAVQTKLQMWQRTPFLSCYNPLCEPAVLRAWAESIRSNTLHFSHVYPLKRSYFQWLIWLLTKLIWRLLVPYQQLTSRAAVNLFPRLQFYFCGWSVNYDWGQWMPFKNSSAGLSTMA